MPKKISIQDRMHWLEEYESGKPIIAIAKHYNCDTRTVKTALEKAREERDARSARIEFYKDALRHHHNMLKDELNRIIKQLEVPGSDFAPLSWNEGDKSIFVRDVKIEDLGLVSGIARGAGRPSESGTRVVDFLRQHLKKDKLLKLLVQWEKSYLDHIADRAALQKKLVSLLGQKTGLRVVDNVNISPPFLYSYNAGHILYKAALGKALKMPAKHSLEEEIIADTQSGTVRYHRSDLAAAPGIEEKCRNDILDAHRELLESQELKQVVSSYHDLSEWSNKSKPAADEIELLGLIPGKCSVCQRLGI